MLQKLIGLFLLCCSGWTLRAQTSPVDSLAKRYRDWLTGEGVNYSNASVNDRYIRFRNAGNGARNLSGYDFANPGPAWDFTSSTDQSAYATLVEQKLVRLVFLYQIKGPATNPNPDYHSLPLRDTILMLFNYMKAKGISDTTDFAYRVLPATEEVITSHYGVALRSSAYATSVFLMKEDLSAAGEFGHHLAALQALTYFISPEFPYFHFTYPGYNTDVIRSSIQQRLCYVLAQDDTSSTRITNMAFLKDFINNALLTGHGWSDCIKPDGLTYHHRGVYANTYGVDALQQASILIRMLKGSSYPLSSAAEQNVKNAVMNYRRFCIDFTMPRGLAGRFPENTAVLDALRPALAYLYIADPAAHADAGQEFVRLWNISPAANTTLQRANTVSINVINTMGGIQDMANTLNAGLAPSVKISTGQFGFPYAGLSLHKYNGWQVSMKGTSNVNWHYENSATENLFGQYTSAGALEILAKGNPVTPDSNGLSFNGWDWAHIPGTTVASLPFNVMANSIMRQFNGKGFLAHAALGNNGVFAMDYKDINSATGMTARKTAFFFGDKILCLGSDIRDAGGTYPIHTTLFQTAFGTGNTGLVNGAVASGNNYTLSQTGGPFWATDAVGNGFVVPASAYNTHSIIVQRSSQTSPNQANTASTTGDFAKAYIDHGAAPASGSYQYAVLVQGGATTQNFAADFDSYFQVLKQDSQAHMVLYVPDSTYSYVVWDTNATLPAGSLLLKANKPSVTLLQQVAGSNELQVSLTNPDMGLLAPGEAYTYSQISSTPLRLYRVPETRVVTISLAGAWQLQTPLSNVSLTANGSNTDVAFSTINGFTIEAVLVRTVPLPLGFTAFSVADRNCSHQLSWHYAGPVPEQYAVERSADSRSWQRLALLPSSATGYTDNDDDRCWYRLAAIGREGRTAYSSIVPAGPGNCAAKIILYPNPTTGRVVLYNKGSRPPAGVIISDLRGQNLEGQVAVRYAPGEIHIDLSSLAPGMYFVRSGTQVYKVAKR
ncbi:chondroitinase family polysaccharide lyase [Taibaiella helva]|uniref:chondroitinase family polysaccharide lyase n=1 Tax=Taibaiella helva TaxID=2301235 RepID=UPI0013004D5E|nr:chondroitinase family polysaccharide lyase [Taibaiella helva]